MAKEKRFDKDFAIEYYASDNVREMAARSNDKYNGALVEFYESGAVSYVRNMRDNRFHGLSYEYRENGSLEAIYDYKDGNMVSMKLYHEARMFLEKTYLPEEEVTPQV